jgi:hypothetical protein
MPHRHGTMSETKPEREDLGTRTFNGVFSAVWAIFLFALFGFVGVPLANALIVCWVRGTDAYLHGGIRVLHGRPLKFSDGISVPGVPEMVSFFAVFIVMVFGLSFLLLHLLRFYEKHWKRRKP